MDVTRQNFVDVFPKIEKAVEDCEFVSVDCELSGLHSNDCSLNLYDTIEERYQKLKKSALGYSVIQFGLSCFIRDTGSNGECKYNCSSFNLYIFPYKTSANVKRKDDSFLVQPSAFAFLSANGFDFNKLFREGINWLSADEEVSLMEKQRPSNGKSCNDFSNVTINCNVGVPEEHKQFVSGVANQLKLFLEDLSAHTLQLDPCSAYRRKLIYEMVESCDYNDYLEATTLSSPTNHRDKYIVINKVSADEKERRLNRLILETVGFTKLIQLLIKSKKPLVGHNLLLDLMHIIHQFIVHLPDTFAEFALLVHEVFPVLYDTKHIASSPNFKDVFSNTSLEEVFTRVKKHPFKPIDVPIAYNSDIKFHEAGFDSFVTGYSFIGLANFLNSDINEFKNIVNVTYIVDIQQINLEHENISPRRNNVFHVSFPQSWKATDLTQLFSAFGSIIIAWINDTSAFIGLKDSSKSADVKKSFKNSQSVCKIQTYYEYVDNVNGCEMRENSKRKLPETKEKECMFETKKKRDDDFGLSDTW